MAQAELPERPDDNDPPFDDDFLIGIIGERFRQLSRDSTTESIDPITYRDIAWILALCDRYRAALIEIGHGHYTSLVLVSDLRAIACRALEDTRPSA